MHDDFEATALEYQDEIAAMSDDEIFQAYLASDAEADDPWQSALAQALEERGIDV
jgi:hypothetical protein